MHAAWKEAKVMAGQMLQGLDSKLRFGDPAATSMREPAIFSSRKPV